MGCAVFGALYGAALLALGIAPTPAVLAVAKSHFVSLALIVPFIETLVFVIVWYATWPLPSRYRASFYFPSMVVLGILGHLGRDVWIVPAVFDFAVMGGQWLTWINKLKGWRTFLAVFTTHSTINSVAALTLLMAR